jgi:CheY-like chemotaxis protein
MAKSGPIIIVEDDLDDQEFITMALKSAGVKNSHTIFINGKLALDYLLVTEEKPFIIVCDINMPVMNGFELRQKINENAYLRQKSIPFIFLTTSDSHNEVVYAYELTIQGFFKKPGSLDELTNTMKEVVGYWRKCRHPNE